MSVWLMLGAGVLMLLIAAIRVKNHKVCKAVKIVISRPKEILFLDEQDILNIISYNGEKDPRGMAIAGINLQLLESRLEKRVWVKDAELFFDNNRVLHAHVEEREPVARIFTAVGSSFYMDSTGKQLPLSNKTSIRLPVFTGFPFNKRHVNHEDSMLIEHIKRISRFIVKDKFWMAQIAQIDITGSRTFELVPTVGRHIIDFGNGENYEAKFTRLFLFYKQVLSQTGFDKYSRVNVQYDNQVIGTKKGMVTRVDSIQALKNMQKMIQEAKRMAGDSLFVSDESRSATADSSLNTIKGARSGMTYNRPKANRPVKVKMKPGSKTPGKESRPKAVMQKGNDR